MVDVIEHYLDTRAARFPGAAKRRSSPGGGLTAWPTAAPLFAGAGERITRSTLQYRVLRAFRRAGIDADRAQLEVPTIGTTVLTGRRTTMPDRPRSHARSFRRRFGSTCGQSDANPVARRRVDMPA